MYRSLAPITNQAWQEIDNRARTVLYSRLSARKSIHVDGPKGPEFTVIAEGRLHDVVWKDDVGFSTYQVHPLIETWNEFSLKRFELDNLTRGAKDIDYAPLEDAFTKAALFEERAIYYGLEEAGIKGLTESSSNNPLTLGTQVSDVLLSIAEGVSTLKKNYANAPFDFICSSELYNKLVSTDSSVPLTTQIKEIIGGQILYSDVLQGGLLLPHDVAEISLTLGTDFELGYKSHDANFVTFYIKESFTFRVIDNSIIIQYQ